MNLLVFVGSFLCVGVSTCLSQRWDGGNPSTTLVDPNNSQTRGTQYQAQDGPPFGRVAGNDGDGRPQPRPQRPLPLGNGNQAMGSQYMAKDGPPFGNVPNRSDPRQPQVTPRQTLLPGPDGTRLDNGIPIYRPSDPKAPIFVNRPPLRNEAPQRRTGNGGREDAQRGYRDRFYRTNQHSADGYKPYSPHKPHQTTGHQHSHSMVAFSGTTKTSQFYYRNTPVIFDKVLTNIGGGYDVNYGIFTVPSSGVYLINYHAVSRPDGATPAALDLVKNRYIINSAVGRGLTGSPSNSAVLFLQPHDRIYIQGRAGSSIYCETGHAYCSFNIVLIGRSGMY